MTMDEFHVSSLFLAFGSGLAGRHYIWTVVYMLSIPRYAHSTWLRFNQMEGCIWCPDRKSNCQLLLGLRSYRPVTEWQAIESAVSDNLQVNSVPCLLNFLLACSQKPVSSLTFLQNLFLDSFTGGSGIKVDLFHDSNAHTVLYYWCRSNQEDQANLSWRWSQWDCYTSKAVAGDT